MPFALPAPPPGAGPLTLRHTTGVGPRPRPDAACRARFAGPVAGAWGGHSFGHSQVRRVPAGFDAELALDAGTALNASLRAGGHRREWMRADDVDQPPGAPLALDIVLSLEGEWRGAVRQPRGWGIDAGGSAFLGTEDAAGRPLSLRLRLDPRRPGAPSGCVHHRVWLPNGCWAPLVTRFAAHLHCSLDDATVLRVRARLSIAPAADGGAPVRTLTACDRGAAPVERCWAADPLCGPAGRFSEEGPASRAAP